MHKDNLGEYKTTQLSEDLGMEVCAGVRINSPLIPDLQTLPHHSRSCSREKIYQQRIPVLQRKQFSVTTYTTNHQY